QGRPEHSYLSFPSNSFQKRFFSELPPLPTSDSLLNADNKNNLQPVHRRLFKKLKEPKRFRPLTLSNSLTENSAGRLLSWECLLGWSQDVLGKLLPV
ncbi:unnamed protein product, partial [Protopolystoma xenopodis]